MNRLIQDNRCHECKKIFCCASCRDLHEKKKHPRPKTDDDCLLCTHKKLPLEKFENSDYLCHLVIRHLPLICVLCGQLYRNLSDLQKFIKCEYWSRKTPNSILQESIKKLPIQATPSPIVKSLSCPAASAVPSEKVSNWYTDTEFHTLQSFRSPPELMRNTSTPMHVGVTSQRLCSQFKTPKVPAFCLKTPRTPTAGSSVQTNNNKSSFINPITLSGSETIDENPSPSLFHSATSQLLSCTSKDINSDNTPFVSITSSSRSLLSGDTPSRLSSDTPNRSSTEGVGYSREFFRSNSGRTLEVMEEQEEQVSINMDLTQAQDHLTPALPLTSNPMSISIAEPAKDAPKKVRFSDQHQYAVAESTVDPVSDSEEFYEAEEIVAVEKSINDKKLEAKMVQENEDNSDKENLESPEDSKVFETPTSPPPSTSAAAASSRVVMMVVVEKGYEISTSSLVPLINSSLQKLERNPLMENIRSPTSSNSSSQSEELSNCLVRSVSSVDTYTASSTVDYYSTQSCPDLSTLRNNGETSSNVSSRGDNGGGGILSAMAQAMRYAFRGLPGTSSSKASPHVGGSANDVRPSGSSTSRTNPSSFSTITTSLLRRPGKRPRDPINDGVIGSYRRELRTPVRNETSISPVAKRPRSWHRIRGRDPIARMRRDTSSTSLTRGVSSETQHFQQGSLSVGDTVLPLPSRAHQSTQTD